MVKLWDIDSLKGLQERTPISHIFIQPFFRRATRQLHDPERAHRAALRSDRVPAERGRLRFIHGRLRRAHKGLGHPEPDPPRRREHSELVLFPGERLGPVAPPL